MNNAPSAKGKMGDTPLCLAMFEYGRGVQRASISNAQPAVDYKRSRSPLELR